MLEAYDSHVLRRYDRREEQQLLESNSGNKLEQQVLDLIFEEIGDPETAARVFVADINPLCDSTKAAYYAARKAFEGNWYLYRNATATIPDESVIERSAQSVTDLYIFLVEIIHQTVKLSSVGKEE